MATLNPYSLTFVDMLHANIPSTMNTANTHVSIPLGIVIGLLASFVQSLGLTIQRKSHVLNQLLPEHKQSVEHRRPLWLLGFAIFISSNILGSLVQIASLPVVILAPLGAVSLLWNAFFARFILGDVFSPWMILGTFFIAGGAILIAVFGIVPEPTRSLEDLLELFRRPAFVAYFSVLGVLVFICLVITHVMDFSLSRKLANAAIHSDTLSLTPPHITIHPPTNPSSLTTGVTETISESITTERTPLLDRKSRNASPSTSSSKSCSEPDDPFLRSINRTRLLLAVSYASFSGILSGMCLLFAKSGVELLLLTVRGHNQFWRWESWVLLLGLVVFALLQLWYLHKALILADPTLVCPSAFCFYNVSSILNGLVYFDQFSLIPPVHLGLVILGIIILLGGVWVVSIQSGGGGVDVGAWNEEGDGLLDAAELDLEVEDGGRRYSIDHPSLANGEEAERGTRRPVQASRGTQSEHILTRSLISPSRTDFRPETSDSTRRPSVANIQIGSANSSQRDTATTSSWAWTPRRRRPTLTLSNGHSRVSTHANSHNPLSPPLGAVSTIGPGFQIGLSPLSPGFTIVPRERRRRVSNLGPGFADVVEDLMVSEHRRRTVSEGDTNWRASAGGEGEGEGEGESGPVNEMTGGSHAESPNTALPNHAQQRWRWLGSVFRGQ